MAQNSLNKYLDGRSCKVQYCLYCGWIVNKYTRGNKKTCSEDHEIEYKRIIKHENYIVRKNIDQEKIRESSRRSRQKLKLDTERYEAQKEKTKQWAIENPDNIKKSKRKAAKKFRNEKPERVKELNLKSRNKVRDEMGEQAWLEREENRSNTKQERRAKKLEELKSDPLAYEEYLAKQRERSRAYRARKRLQHLQQDLQKMVNENE